MFGKIGAAGLPAGSFAFADPHSAELQLAGTELTAWPVDRPVLMSELIMIVPFIRP